MKENIQYIFFDCMETIIDLYRLPTESDYALWAFSGSGVESYWESFDHFLIKYIEAKRDLMASRSPYEEYEMVKRFEWVVERTETLSSVSNQQVTAKLYENFWETYKSQCFIKDEIMNVLPELTKRYKLAVVSNFMVENGIEELLQLNRAGHFFDYVVTSINAGWRKPSVDIYELAIQYAGCPIEQIVFVGDDYENDVLAPRRLGMKAIWLQKDAHKETEFTLKEIHKVSSFSELKALLLG
jgi:putative hydrolase of the HAD superfamily